MKVLLKGINTKGKKVSEEIILDSKNPAISKHAYKKVRYRFKGKDGFIDRTKPEW